MAVEPAPVKVVIEKMTFTLETADTGPRGAKAAGPGYYPVRSILRRVEDTVAVVKLNNGLVEAWVCPAYGARLLRARDIKTGVDYFYWKEGAPLPDKLAWSPGGVKPSFPFFEHGTHLRQPAGWRVVRDADGGATVACDMRFTHHTTPADRARYGRFGDESLNVMVGLKPGSTIVHWRQRKENPNPLPRGDRMWNDTLFPVEVVTRRTKVVDKKSGAESESDLPDQEEMRRRNVFIFPACWVVDHGPTTVHTSPHWSSLDNWGVSHFAISAPYGFTGVCYPQRRLNRLRINDTDPAKGAAAKMYTIWGEFTEIWGGHGIVFEKPGDLRPAYEPVEFTHRFYLAQGIGAVSYANDDAAVAISGTQFEMISPRDAAAQVRDGTGRVVADGAVGPHTVLKGDCDGRRLTVRLDGRLVLDRTFPLPRPVPAKDTPVPPEVQAAFNKLAGPDPLFFEKCCVGCNEGQASALEALGKTAQIQNGKDPVGTLSLARTVYRFGALDEAARLARLCPGPDADFLLGLIAWEKGEDADFKSAAWEADYMRALQTMQKNDRGGALRCVDRYLEHVPTAWRPRLAKAFWSGDKELAGKLADENFGSPEAQLVLRLLGAPHELDKLLANNPSAAEHLKLFEEELTKGAWKHMPRYPVGGGAQ